MRIYTLLAAVILAATTATAAPVTRGQALADAKVFMQTHGMGQPDSDGPCSGSTARHAATATATAVQPYYIINAAANRGFVIMSGNDLTTPVLGYATDGHIDADNMPTAMSELLGSYERQIKWLNAHEDDMVSQAANAQRDDVAPLIGSIWHQDSPFNAKTPLTSNGTHASTGCTATAMSQVMYYHKWPQDNCEVIPAYDLSDDEELALFEITKIDDPLPPVTFNWDAMQPDSDPDGAAALLNQYCGQALQMAYNDDNGESGAYTYNMARALVDYFGYDPGISVQMSAAYGSAQWDDMVYTELSAGRPVIYAATSDMMACHAFVIEGYHASDDTYYVNWGWGGSSNGYYVLDVLKLVDTNSSATYSLTHLAIMGIQPQQQDTELPAAQLTLCSYGAEQSKTFADLSNPYHTPWTGELRYHVKALATGNETYIGNTAYSIEACIYADFETDLTPWAATVTDGRYQMTLEAKAEGDTCFTSLNMHRGALYMIVEVKNGEVVSVLSYPDALTLDGTVTATLTTDADVEKFDDQQMALTVTNNDVVDYVGTVELYTFLHSSEMTELASLLSQYDNNQLLAKALNGYESKGMYAVNVAPGEVRTFHVSLSFIGYDGTYITVAINHDTQHVMAATAYHVGDVTGVQTVTPTPLAPATGRVYDIGGTLVSDHGIDGLPAGVYVYDGHVLAIGR